MARIKIRDLSAKKQVGKDEMKSIRGGMAHVAARGTKNANVVFTPGAITDANVDVGEYDPKQ